MSKDRFLHIWRNLHLCDNAQPTGKDKLYKVREFITILQSTFKKIFTPSGYFAVDESMMKWKGRLGWRQFMPNKPIRFGMKVWALCDSVTGYMYNFQIYTGKENGRPEKNLSARVVTDLVEPLYYTNAQLFMDNFYTGYQLIKDLLAKKVYACGTVRANRKDLPKDIVKKTIVKHNFEIAQRQNVLFCSWQDTKKVNFLSNYHSPSDMGIVRRKNEKKERVEIDAPKVVADYNDYMNAVDKLDQKISYYMGALKSNKWWRRVFFYFLQVSMINSYIFAKSKNPSITDKYPKQLSFIEELANCLIGDYSTERHTMSVNLDLAPLRDAKHNVAVMFTTRVACRECKITKPNLPTNRRVTYHGCKTCKVAIHMKCQNAHNDRMN
jgi:hypothetical protein